ncbi:MAG: UDP-glucose 4-epimerase GalE [Propionicimonas sp.]|nr:UDP-glucose 4-epimerase GalE [Propionicimonas sp.]
MSWLVTGGAGYIGSHVVRELQHAGITPVVIDDLSSGHASFVPDGVRFVRGSILDPDAVREAIDPEVRGVIHVAGFKYAGVSVQRPLHTYAQNVEGTRVLLEIMAERGVQSIVFSSSAAVYGTPVVDLVVEDTAKHPTSPYGESKLIDEWLIADEAVARAASQKPLRFTCLRYFNVVGSGERGLPDTSPHNLFPIVFDTLLAGGTPHINGDDYNTPDGTNVRDYIHVADLAAAHVEAARTLESGGTLEPAYNLGSGTGLSVRQIMEAMAEVTGIDFTATVGPRRPGDPDRIVASGELAARDLGWTMRHSVADMVRSAWEARRAWQGDHASPAA